MPTSDLFVHARLPDGTSHIVGRYRHVAPDLGSTKQIGEFQYAGSWLRNDHAHAFPLHPVSLPLTDGVVVTTVRSGLFGVLADATPDAWGRRLIRLERQGDPMSPTDWLLATGDDRVGCLAFSPTPQPPAYRQDFLGIRRLPDIAREFEKIAEGKPANPRAEQIYLAGRSLGGARPKAVVEMDGALWIAKFQRRDDDYDQCAAEHAAMHMARLCGIDAAPTKLVDLGKRRAVLVKRFDRTEGAVFHPNAHYLSALSLLGLDDTSDDGSYPAIADEIRRHCARQREDRIELFRRMVYNVIVGNRDDHLKNQALLHDAGSWRLSPAFDVLPQPDFYPMQAIGVGRFGPLPNVENCLSQCGDFGLASDDAQAIIDAVLDVVRRWPTVFAEQGVDVETIARVRRAFVAMSDG